MVSSHNLKHAHVGTQSKISSFRCLGAHNAYGLGEGQLQQTVYCIDTICVFTHTLIFIKMKIREAEDN
jgi:hypothetical protein